MCVSSTAGWDQEGGKEWEHFALLLLQEHVRLGSDDCRPVGFVAEVRWHPASHCTFLPAEQELGVVCSPTLTEGRHVCLPFLVDNQQPPIGLLSWGGFLAPDHRSGLNYFLLFFLYFMGLLLNRHVCDTTGRTSRLVDSS